MKIAICGSMVFSSEMERIAKELEGMGHEAFLPEGTSDYLSVTDPDTINKAEGAEKKIQKDLIRKHYNLIKESDAVLIVNMDKKGVVNYLGGNSFLEMGFAYILGKKIYLLNDIPEIDLIYQEIVAMQPVILNGEVSKIS